ncbi:hypothetical protein [Streptomyces sp. WMMC897]|uniref:hypothetical protein n=1 Tax=Streptomyces sp. WMMC897 TaxID=3014782 RepID=UPI0022B64D8D|nr:hypothetical protein [Streptomyces sp. WMMC897]MCZ7417688.1 hypothetical protein [Streptomyces sp. WMMC897]
MTTQPTSPSPKGAALALILVGAAVATAAFVTMLVTGERSVATGTASLGGVALQIAGWRAARRRNGGAA